MKKYLNLLLVALFIIFGYSACKNDSASSGDSTPAPDTGGPVITFVNPVQNGVVSGIIQIAGTAEDASDIASVDLQIDGSPIADPENIVITGHYFSYAVDTFADLTEEAHAVIAQATDANGNTGEAVTLDFIVNHEFPAIQVNNPAHGALIRGATVPVEGTASTTAPASISAVKVDPDGSGTDFTYLTATYSNPDWDGQFDSTILADGDYTFAAVASADNGNSAIVNVSITVDNTQPTVAITSHSDNQAVATTTVTIGGTAGDNVELDKVEIELNSSGTQELAQGTTSWQYTINNLLADQANTIVATATDTAGNTQTHQITLYQDSLPPVITVTTAPAGGSYNTGTINLIGTVTNLLVTDPMEIKINSDPFTNVDSFDGVNWSNPIDTITDGIPDGALTITLRATKANTGSTSTYTINCFADNTVPTGTIASPAENGAEVSGQVIIAGTADDAIALAAANGVYILIEDDNNSAIVNEEADITASLSGGQWSYLWDTATPVPGYTDYCTITVTLTDQAGNNTVLTRLVTQTNTAPSVTVSVQDPEHDGGSIVHGLLTISGSATDTAGATPGIQSVELWFDSLVDYYSLIAADFTGNTLPYAGTDTWSYDYDSTALAEGSHDLHVKVTDQDGGSNEVLLTIEVDNIDPVVTIDYPTSANTGDSNFLYSTVNAAGTASDINLDTVAVEVDSQGPVAPTGTSSWSYSWDTAAYPTAQNGTAFKATATDLAGNTGTDTVNVDVRPKITSLSVNTELIGQSITINGFNFDTTAGSVDVIFQPGSGSETINTESADGNTLTVTIPATATSGDVYITESTIDSDRVHLDVWEWKTIAVGSASDQALALSGTNAYQAIYNGGGTKELWFSQNAAAGFVLEDGSTTAPPASTSLGENPSIAVYDNAGTDVVYTAYIDKTNTDLYFIKSNAAIVDITDFDDSVLVVSAAITRTTTSIAYDPGTPATIGITYQSDTGDLMYVESSDSGAAWGTPQTVDAGAGLYSSLAFDSSGTPCIAYYDETNSQIKFAYYTGTFWATDQIESTPFQGEYPSITIDTNDGIHVSYYDGGSGDLKYAFASGRTAAFSATTVDYIGITGTHTAIALDESGAEPLPHISYINNNYLTIRYAYYDGTAWNLLIAPASIGTASAAGTGIAVGSDGNVYISYVDGANAYQLIYRP